MFLRSNEKDDFFTTAFVLSQFILMLIMCLAVLHNEVCPPDSNARRAEEEEETSTCLVFGAPYFGAALMFAQLLIMFWHIGLASHCKPRLPLEDKECLGKLGTDAMSPREHEHLVALQIQRLTLRNQMLFGLTRITWVFAAGFHWVAIGENDAKGVTMCYSIAHVCDTVLTAMVFAYGGWGNPDGPHLKYFTRRVTNTETGELEWCTHNWIVKQAAADQMTHYRLPIHTPFYMNRHKAFAAIAFGESVLQLTGANNSEVWEPNAREYFVGVCGLIIFYCLGAMYFASFNGLVHDHAIRTTGTSHVLWSEMQVIVIVSLIFIGAGFEAAWKANAEMILDPAEAVRHGHAAAEVMFTFGIFTNALVSCMLNLLGQDRQRMFAWYPIRSCVIFILLPLAAAIVIFIPHTVSGSWRSHGIKTHVATNMCLVLGNYIYHVHVMDWLFYYFTHFEELRIDDLSREAVRRKEFQRDNVLRQKEELDHQLAQLDAELRVLKQAPRAANTAPTQTRDSADESAEICSSEMQANPIAVTPRSRKAICEVEKENTQMSQFSHGEDDVVLH